CPTPLFGIRQYDCDIYPDPRQASLARLTSLCNRGVADSCLEAAGRALYSGDHACGQKAREHNKHPICLSQYGRQGAAMMPGSCIAAEMYWELQVQAYIDRFVVICRHTDPGKDDACAPLPRRLFGSSGTLTVISDAETSYDGQLRYCSSLRVDRATSESASFSC